MKPRLGPQEWLDYIKSQFNVMESERLRTGLFRMVVYCDKHNLYYETENGQRRPFSEKIVQAVLDLAKKSDN